MDEEIKSPVDVTPSKGMVTHKKIVQWTLLREDWLAQNLRRKKGDPPYNYKQLAAAHDVSYLRVRQVAAQQNWQGLLKERQRELEEQAQEHLKGVALFDEIEIRTRQATYARLASSLAEKKLRSLDEKRIAKMSIKDAIELMKLGLTEERQALGIGDTVRIPTGGSEHAKVLSDQQVFAVARRVMELRRHEDGSYGPDTVSTGTE